MPVITLQTDIHAPIELVFDLTRSIDFHQSSMSHSSEKAVGGVTSGLIDIDQTVTWEAVHFGIRQRLTSQITICDRPSHLQDTMVSGAFRGFVHDHFFSEIGEGTLMKDVFDYSSPFGLMGRAVDRIFLERYMADLLARRNLAIKDAAEGDDWKDFV